MYGFCASAALPRSGIAFGATAICTRPAQTSTAPDFAPGEIRGAKHVQKKAIKKVMDRRPKKKRPSDINRKPPPFNVDPMNADGVTAEYTVLGVVDEPSVEAAVAN